MIRSRQGGRKSAAPESAIAAAPEAAPAPEQAQEPEAAPALEPAPAIAPDAAPAAPSGDARGYAAAALSFQPVNHFTVHDFFQGCSERNSEFRKFRKFRPLSE